MLEHRKLQAMHYSVVWHGACHSAVQLLNKLLAVVDSAKTPCPESDTSFLCVCK